jgi:hypothetical protein
MERGLMWLPLLALFIGLAWAGWREFRKVEAYQTWAQDFDRHKYDIYAVLGQKGDQLVWGKPTRQANRSICNLLIVKPRYVQIELKLRRRKCG